MADFELGLEKMFRDAEEEGKPSITVRAGDLHKQVGGYPGPDHRMPMCCNAMRGAMQDGDKIVEAPPKGNGANLYIRYRLPR